MSFVVFPVMAMLHVLSPAEIFRLAPPCKGWPTTVGADVVIAAEVRITDGLCPVEGASATAQMFCTLRCPPLKP